MKNNYKFAMLAVFLIALLSLNVQSQLADLGEQDIDTSKIQEGVVDPQGSTQTGIIEEGKQTYEEFVKELEEAKRKAEIKAKSAWRATKSISWIVLIWGIQIIIIMGLVIRLFKWKWSRKMLLFLIGNFSYYFLGGWLFKKLGLAVGGKAKDILRTLWGKERKKFKALLQNLKEKREKLAANVAGSRKEISYKGEAGTRRLTEATKFYFGNARSKEYKAIEDLKKTLKELKTTNEKIKKNFDEITNFTDQEQVTLGQLRQLEIDKKRGMENVKKFVDEATISKLKADIREAGPTIERELDDVQFIIDKNKEILGKIKELQEIMKVEEDKIVEEGSKIDFLLSIPDNKSRINQATEKIKEVSGLAVGIAQDFLKNERSLIETFKNIMNDKVEVEKRLTDKLEEEEKTELYQSKFSALGKQSYKDQGLDLVGRSGKVLDTIRDIPTLWSKISGKHDEISPEKFFEWMTKGRGGDNEIARFVREDLKEQRLANLINNIKVGSPDEAEAGMKRMDALFKEFFDFKRYK
ncbi:hypothetical protein ACFLZ7_01820 [Nanoarchaeota archaeon]